MATIVIVCGWCGKVIGNREGKKDKQVQGICDNCLNHQFPHLADLIRSCLDVDTIEKTL